MKNAKMNFFKKAIKPLSVISQLAQLNIKKPK